jgi:ribonuclease BN (tRNA processing enzyme)/polynucleotide 5'-kinase involved in rRNA processing
MVQETKREQKIVSQTHRGDRGTIAILKHSPPALVDALLAEDRRILLFGAPGSGKSTLATDLARELALRGRGCTSLSADPGSPAFGVPGTLCAGEWREGHWQLRDSEALCSLDAGRFRLPLISALRRLAERWAQGTSLVDPPGVVRGVAGAELLLGIVEAANIDIVLVLTLTGMQGLPLRAELEALAADVYMLRAAPKARTRSKQQRARDRTRLWQRYLESSAICDLDLSSLSVIGTPPPIDAHDEWLGRQIALLDGKASTLSLGEVMSKEAHHLTIKYRSLASSTPRLLLVRDARCDASGLLRSAKPIPAPVSSAQLPPDMTLPHAVGTDDTNRPVVRLGPATAVLVNGIFGDPLLHLRFRHQKRSLLFDLGEAGRLPARIIHQVSDVFITHAHFDHIAGFLWLLRSRIGQKTSCRVYGPPGLTDNLECLIRGIHWDRIGERGPQFEIGEFDGERLARYRIRAGKLDRVRLEERHVQDGLLLVEASFQVRAVILDHGTPVLGFAFETARELNIRKDRLVRRRTPPGPWLDELKTRLNANELEAEIQLPDGSRERAVTLGEELVVAKPGVKLAYVTDLADTPDNRARVAALASGAHALFCEATFLDEDAPRAARTQHLTAGACGAIGAAAQVERLVPFHFSRRYQKLTERVYAQVRAVCPQTIRPGNGCT